MLNIITYNVNKNIYIYEKNNNQTITNNHNFSDLWMYSILFSSWAVLLTQATDMFTTPSVPYCLFASSKEPCTFSQIFLGNVYLV